MPVCVSYNDTAYKGSSSSILPVRSPEKHSPADAAGMAEDTAAISAGIEGDRQWATFWRLHLNSELATGTEPRRVTSGKWELAWLLIPIAFAVEYF